MGAAILVKGHVNEKSLYQMMKKEKKSNINSFRNWITFSND